MTEVVRTFTCFGGPCTIAVDGEGSLGPAMEAVEATRDLLLGWHATFSRFKPESELSGLNEDPAEVVAISPMMARFLLAAQQAVAATGGLVDAALLDRLEEAGYSDDHMRASMSLPLALALTRGRRQGSARPDGVWDQVEVDVQAGTVRRPPGVRFDGGGIVKGLCADAVAELLEGYASYAVDCDADMRFGGTDGVEREVELPNPFKGPTLHRFSITDGAVSICSIEKASWMRDGMKPAHHIIDPSTGASAFTGVVQVAALAPTALQGESRAKAAVLSGPEGAADWLVDGGFIVLDDGSYAEVKPS